MTNKENTTSFLLRIETDKYEEVKKRAKGANTSINSFIANAIEAALIVTTPLLDSSGSYVSAYNNTFARGIISNGVEGTLSSNYVAAVEKLAGNPQEDDNETE